METNKKKHKILWIGLGGFIGIIILIISIIGGKMYMDTKREEALYKHGFRLLEEQLAIYTKEHYEGVSKIEFSPIFEDGGDGYSMYTLKMVPVIYDKHGNRAIMGGKIGKVHHAFYGLNGGLTLDFDGGDGSEVIILKNLDTGEEVDVSGYKHIPTKAKLDSYQFFDENIEDLVRIGQLKGVKKSDKGSPTAKVTYNTEIRQGDYQEWH